MGKRVDLQGILENVLEQKHVYFQPPATIKISYPAIIYELNNVRTTKADNRNYLKYNRYKVTLIHKDPDNDIKDKLLELPLSSMSSPPYVSDGLNHYVFEIYY